MARSSKTLARERPVSDDDTVAFRRGDTGELPPFVGFAGGDERFRRELPPPTQLAPGPKRARTGLVTGLGFVLLLVVVAAGGNQWVSDKLADRVTRMEHGYLPAQAGLTYGWRFSARGGSDVGHAWLAQLVSVGAFVVLATLLIAPVVRGVVTWFRAFFGVLGAVVVGTALARMVYEGLLTGPAATPRDITRAERILFYSSTGPSVIASLVIGLGAALILATVAVATRRTPALTLPPLAAEPEPVAAPEPPPPYYGEADDSWRPAPPAPAPGPASAASGDGDRWVPASGPWNAPADGGPAGLVGEPAPEAPRRDETADAAHHETAVIQPPAADPSIEHATTEFPRLPDEAPHDAATESATTEHETTEFPRLPDDEHEPLADDELPHRDRQ